MINIIKSGVFWCIWCFGSASAVGGSQNIRYGTIVSLLNIIPQFSHNHSRGFIFTKGFFRVNWMIDKTVHQSISYLFQFWFFCRQISCSQVIVINFHRCCKGQPSDSYFNTSSKNKTAKAHKSKSTIFKMDSSTNTPAIFVFFDKKMRNQQNMAQTMGLSEDTA